MLPQINVVLLFIVCVLNPIFCHPTVYRMKDNKILEADLVPVSSTVIPLPSYQVGYGLNVSHGIKYPKISHYDSTKLVTDQNKKKYYYGEKKQQYDSKKKVD